jgi:hypothetical protein
VVEIDLRQILSELKIKRRQMDRAIAALESVVDGTQRYKGKRITTKQAQRRLSAEKGDGITGPVPFPRGLKLIGS